MKLSNQNHLDRPTLLSEDLKTNEYAQSHVSDCEECAFLNQIFGYFAVAGKERLAKPSELVRQNVYSVFNATEKTSATSGIQQLVAKLKFDSWLMPAMAGVRIVSMTNTRQMRFEFEDLIVDLRAELGRDKWSFLAKIDGSKSDCVLIRDGKASMPDEHSMFHWSSNRPPRKIKIRCGERVISLPEFTWKKTH